MVIAHTRHVGCVTYYNAKDNFAIYVLTVFEIKSCQQSSVRMYASI